jgi:hypothetical protein
LVSHGSYAALLRHQDEMCMGHRKAGGSVYLDATVLAQDGKCDLGHKR